MKSLSHYKKVLAWALKHYRAKHDVTLETENGLLSVGNKDWLIGKHLFVHREYETEFIKHSIEFLAREGWLKSENNDALLDIGANLGMIGIAMARKKYFKNVLAFEPTPESFRLLEKNVKQNLLEDRIECFNVALSSENTTFRLEIAADNSGDNRIKLSGKKGEFAEQHRATVEIEAVTFDDFLASRPKIDQKKIDLIWMDIQGHEGHFFKGAENFLKRRKIPCVSEFWGYGIKRARMTADEYCAILKTVFTHFYKYAQGKFEFYEIDEIKNLFEARENPRRIESLIFVNRTAATKF